MLRFWISSVSIYYGTESDISVKSYVWICTELRYFILSNSIYYGTQSDFRVKSCCRSNFLRVSVLNSERLDRLRHSIGHPSTKLLSFNFRRASVLNFERLDILRNSIGLPSEKLLSFEFATSFCFQFWASPYVIGLNRTSEWKVIVVRICYELRF